jgi:hypothetical protein
MYAGLVRMFLASVFKPGMVGSVKGNESTASITGPPAPSLMKMLCASSESPHEEWWTDARQLQVPSGLWSPECISTCRIQCCIAPRITQSATFCR